jgi:outer membrane protein assembly factor BamB
MRRTILLLAAALGLGVPVALAGGGGGGAFPQRIALPDGFAPEGIETKGTTVYVGSVGTGAIWKGDVKRGTGDVFIAGRPNERSATGIEYDSGRLWVAGARFGNVLVYDARTGALLHTIQLATGTAPTFINDLVVTKDAAWLTDSQRPVLYKVAVSKDGTPGAVTTVALSGDYAHVAGFNLNGIVATKHGDALIAVQSAAKKLYAIDPDTGAAKLIDLGGYDLANGDGLLLQWRTLYVVQNQLDKVAVFTLSKDLSKATFVQTITTADPTLLSVPTTIDRFGKRLYVVNARFGRTTPTDQRYWITRLR